MHHQGQHSRDALICTRSHRSGSQLLPLYLVQQSLTQEPQGPPRFPMHTMQPPCFPMHTMQPWQPSLETPGLEVSSPLPPAGSGRRVDRRLGWQAPGPAASSVAWQPSAASAVGLSRGSLLGVQLVTAAQNGRLKVVLPFILCCHGTCGRIVQGSSPLHRPPAYVCREAPAASSAVH